MSGHDEEQDAESRPTPEETSAPDAPLKEFVALYETGQAGLRVTDTPANGCQPVVDLDTNGHSSQYEHEIRDAVLAAIDTVLGEDHGHRSEITAVEEVVRSELSDEEIDRLKG
ncbi:hypothetical protein [Halomarina litorea]|uniref:hypothetical protein n=1 Tax=Halomarina litorea TaxID=2961595 RepID=UPI0020C234CB|nr:hypothetical protein [Halomarina sp. BCD28]